MGEDSMPDGCENLDGVNDGGGTGMELVDIVVQMKEPSCVPLCTVVHK